jgi:hypothetical protein
VQSERTLQRPGFPELIRTADCSGHPLQCSCSVCVCICRSNRSLILLLMQVAHPAQAESQQRKRFSSSWSAEFNSVALLPKSGIVMRQPRPALGLSHCRSTITQLLAWHTAKRVKPMAHHSPATHHPRNVPTRPCLALAALFLGSSMVTIHSAQEPLPSRSTLVHLPPFPYQPNLDMVWVSCSFCSLVLTHWRRGPSFLAFMSCSWLLSHRPLVATLQLSAPA